MKNSKTVKIGKRKIVIEERSLYDLLTIQTYQNQALKRYNPVVIMANSLSYAIKSKRLLFFKYRAIDLLRKFTPLQIKTLLDEVEELETHGVQIGKKKTEPDGSEISWSVMTALLFRFYGFTIEDLKHLTPFWAGIYLDQIGNITRFENGKSLIRVPIVERAFQSHLKSLGENNGRQNR